MKKFAARRRIKEINATVALLGQIAVFAGPESPMHKEVIALRKEQKDLRDKYNLDRKYVYQRGLLDDPQWKGKEIPNSVWNKRPPKTPKTPNKTPTTEK